MANLPKGLKKNASGYYYDGPDPRTGARTRPRLGTDYSEALEQYRRLLAGEKLDPDALAFEEFCDKQFLPEVFRPGRQRTAQSGRDAATRLRGHAYSFLGHLPLTEVNKVPELHRFAAHLQKKGLSKESCRKIVKLVRQALSYAVDCDLLPRAVSIKDVLPEMPDLYETDPKRLTDDELVVLERVLSTRPRHELLLVMLNLLIGVRREELTNMLWFDVHADDARPYVHIPKTKNGRKRDVDLTPEAVAVLKELQGWKKRRPGYVCPLTYCSIANIYKRTREACGFAWTWHALRHTWASRLGEAGIDPHVLMGLGGWSSLHMVQRYCRLSRRIVHAEVQRVNVSAFPKPEPETAELRHV